MRCFPLVILIGVLCLSLGCEPIERDESSGGAQSPSASDRPAGETSDWKNVERVHEDLKQVMDATASGDAKTLMSYMHPKVLSIAQNEAMALESVQVMLDKIKNANIVLGEIEFPEAPDFLETKESHFVIAPTQIVIDIQGNKLEIRSYQFGEKSRSGGDWKYLSGDKVTKDTVHRWFPEFPDNYTFPEMTRRPIE